jgi:hypothetical protein
MYFCRCKFERKFFSVDSYQKLNDSSKTVHQKAWKMMLCDICETVHWSWHQINIFLHTNAIMFLFSTDSYFSLAVGWFRLLLITDCSTVVTGFSGVIESPNFPSQYPDGLDCMWNITAPRGNKINATFSHFELEDNSWLWSIRPGETRVCAHDYVEVQFSWAYEHSNVKTVWRSEKSYCFFFSFFMHRDTWLIEYWAFSPSLY